MASHLVVFGEQIEVPAVEHTASTMANHVEQELRQQWLEVEGAHSNVREDEKPRGTVAMDSACTVCIIGANEIPYVDKVWDAPPVRITTSNGTVVSKRQGSLTTAHGPFVGYIVPSSQYSLWAMEDEIDKGAIYTQSKHYASMQYPDGTVRNYDKHHKLWVTEVIHIDSDSEYEERTQFNFYSPEAKTSSIVKIELI